MAIEFLSFLEIPSDFCENIVKIREMVQNNREYVRCLTQKNGGY